ncbi:MAG: hypothetical protein PHN72_03525 [Bacilli bacterium]|nr:hypothetical protein [Bacilli bacterium]
MPKVTIEVPSALELALAYNKEVQWSRKNIFYILKLALLDILVLLLFGYLLYKKEIVFMIIALIAFLFITLCLWYLFYEYKTVRKILSNQEVPKEKNTYTFTEKQFTCNDKSFSYQKIKKVQQTKNYLALYIEETCYIIPYQKEKEALNPYMKNLKKELKKQYILYR